MKRSDFVYLNVPALVVDRDIPSTGQWPRLAITFSQTQIGFLKDTGLLRKESKAQTSSVAETVLRLSDLTEEGQDFVMSKALESWLSACDRRNSKMLGQGYSEEERLRVYADPKGLYSRLEKFRKQRAAKLH